MTREQKTELMKRTKRIRRASGDMKEVRGTYWGVSAVLLLYLIVVCVLKGYGFAGVAVGGAAMLLGAFLVEIVPRLDL